MMDKTKSKLNNANETQVEGNVVKLTSVETEYKPKNKSENVHAGHRARLRMRFINTGLDSFEDHNALELFLFYAIPNRDVNDLAHDLINEFGSLAGVFDARFEDLCKIKGISEYSASLIKLLPSMARRYEQSKISDKNPILDEPQKIAEYMQGLYFGINKEILYMLCLDSACKLQKCIKLGEGEIDKVSVSYRSIAEQALITNAANIIVVHNHISGITAPSPQDILFTANLIETMKGIGIRISDHIIMGNGTDFLSLRKSRKWSYLFNK